MSLSRSFKSLVKKSSSLLKKKSSPNIISDDTLEILKTHTSEENLSVVFRGNKRGIVNAATGGLEIEPNYQHPDSREVFGLFDYNKKIKKKVHRSGIEEDTFKHPENWSDWTDEGSVSKKASAEEEKTSSSSPSKSI